MSKLYIKGRVQTVGIKADFFYPKLISYLCMGLLIPNQPSYELSQYVLSILPKCNHLNHLKQLQAFLLTLGHAQTQFFAFKLVRFCTLTLTNLNYGRSIFNQLESPNVYLYSAMITAYSSEPNHGDAIALYRSMVRKGCPSPNQFIYPHVLKSCSDFLGSRAIESVHSQILKLGFGHYPVVQTALVDSYSRSCSGIRFARRLFDEMSIRNVVSWTAMISGYTRMGKMEDAILMFEGMPDRDVPSWNAVIAGCTQNGLFSEAISLFRKMVLMAEGPHRDIRPNGVSLVCSLSACGHTGKLQLGKCLHGYVYRNLHGGDSFVSNALVDMYGKCGCLKEANRVFDMTEGKSLTAWNSMINCFSLHGQSKRAISIFEDMVRQGDDVKPDEVTFIGLLNACVHGGLIEKGRFYFELMTRDYGIKPQIEHYGGLIDLLGRAGRFEEILEVVNRMDIEPDEVVWGSLLNGCTIYNRTDLAELAVKKLYEIDPNNDVYHIMLANMYSKLGKWDEVRNVRKVLYKRNSYKTPGCSWIEVNTQVHQFYSFDKTHDRTDDIYKTLVSLFGLY